MKDKKKIVIGVLCALIMIMAVGYALLSQQLSINGTANITSTWKIEITNITEKERHGGVTEKSKSYDAMTANFDVGFTSPGDYITYDVEVTNSGTLDAVIERINVVTNDNPAIIYTTTGIEEGNIIEHNSKKYLTVKIEYDSSVTSQPQTNNNGLTLQLFSAQNLGSPDVEEEHDIYAFHTTELATDATYTDLQTIMSKENREIYETSEEIQRIHLYYLKYKILGNRITEKFVCFLTDNEYCMKGGDNGEAYSSNVEILETNNAWFRNHQLTCHIDSSATFSYCGYSGGNLGYISTTKDGYVQIISYSDLSHGTIGRKCVIGNDGVSYCYE